MFLVINSIHLPQDFFNLLKIYLFALKKMSLILGRYLDLDSTLLDDSSRICFLSCGKLNEKNISCEEQINSACGLAVVSSGPMRFAVRQDAHKDIYHLW